jgi:predicted  nucleic acid-binding Zn-ribbon protein
LQPAVIRSTLCAMLPEIERLLILQDRDKKARALRNELKTVPLERKSLEEKLAAAKLLSQETHQRQRAAEVEQARLENEIRSRKEQIAKYETQKMQTRKNEEYQALNHSIAHVRGEISGIEDRQLQLMEALDQLKPQVAEADRAAAAAADVVQRQLADLEKKSQQLTAHIADLDAGRETLTAGLDEDLLDDYKRLFATKNEAVVGLRNEVCSGCHMKVTIATVTAVKSRKSVVHCEQCNRILYPD